ncbi:MAG: cyclodeaminase/cyclohydrolase family protein [Firmicutes bacterium]|nr:cyclodeaminase/cyclohydrolase family protein [Bacillota bacterium]
MPETTENIDFLQLSAREFADKTASADPVPGGGGAAAYVGALGMGLVNMVSRLTVGKKKYAEVEAEVTALLAEGEEIRAALLAAVQADADAFAPLAAAYALPNTTNEEKAAKAAKLSELSREAAELPLQAAAQAVEGLRIARRIAECGSRLVISDAGCGAALLLAAVKSFDFTARINLGAIQDEEYVQAAYQRLNELLKQSVRLEAEARQLADERLL